MPGKRSATSSAPPSPTPCEAGTSHMAALVAELHAAAQRRPAAIRKAGLDDTLAALAADYGADVAKASRSDRVDAAVGRVFGLSATDVAVLWAAAAPDLDGNVGLAYAQLRGATGVSACTVALALELTGVPTASADAFARLGPRAALRRHRLVDIVGAEPWGQRRVLVPEPVLAVLAGAAPDDPVVAPLRCAANPLDLPGRELISAALEQGTRLIWIRSVRGGAGVSLAAGALDSLQVGTFALDLRRLDTDAVLADVLAVAVREAGLRRCALIIANADPLAERGTSAAFDVLADAPVPVLAVSARPWDPAWLARLPLLVEADRLSVEQRAELWRAEFDTIERDDQILLGLRMDPAAIAEAARYARLLAAARGEQVSPQTVREAAHRMSTSANSTVTRHAGSSGDMPRFTDLQLPATTAAALKQLVNWARHRDEVAANGLLRGSGRGIAAMFAGNPGTGKTLAANVVANELSMDLFQVDLSSVVDKYIGETEKNLEKVFQAAEALDVVLFFDEADALFGNRAEVRDARDRYANQEIAYLLQRMEQFDGISILATNLPGNLDRAFLRRMSFVISFPDPDATIRRRLWEHHLGQLDELDTGDPVQLDFLAEQVELAGGDIRNIVRAAAYDAVSAGEPVGMRHVAAATNNEYRKLGRVRPDHGFVVPNTR